MPKTVEYLFDLAAPNCYLAWYPLRDIVTRTGAELVVTPVLLGGIMKLTGNAPPMVRDAGVTGKVEYAALEFRRFLDRHGLNRFVMHPALPFNSILPQRVLVAARDEGERQALVEALLPAVWERSIDCTDASAVRAELVAGGFDVDPLMADAQDPAVKQRLVSNTQQAVERGAFGVPTFFIEGEMWFGKERLGQLEQALEA